MNLKKNVFALFLLILSGLMIGCGETSATNIETQEEAVQEQEELVVSAEEPIQVEDEFELPILDKDCEFHSISWKAPSAWQVSDFTYTPYDKKTDGIILVQQMEAGNVKTPQTVFKEYVDGFKKNERVRDIQEKNKIINGMDVLNLDYVLSVDDVDYTIHSYNVYSDDIFGSLVSFGIMMPGSSDGQLEEALDEIMDTVQIKPLDYKEINYYERDKEENIKSSYVLTGIVDNVNCSKTMFTCDVWYEDEDGTYNLSDAYDYDIDEAPGLYAAVSEIKNGDVVRLYYDPSTTSAIVGAHDLVGAEVVSSMELSDIYDIVLRDTPRLDYNAVSRNPDDYVRGMYVLKGKIFQIVDEGYTCEYLVKTSDGYVYVNYARREENRDSRFLENDNVVLYGKFTGLKTYDTLISNKTVPEMFTILMELN